VEEKSREQIESENIRVSVLRQQKDEQRKSRTRLALLDAAVEVFVEKGYHSTLISDIVAKAGVGQGTFYRNFSTKREIFEVVFDRFVETAIGQFREMAVNLPTNQDEYYRASLSGVTKLASVILENKRAARMFLREAVTVDEAFSQKTSEFYHRFAVLAQFYLDHAIQSGFARSCDSELVAHFLVGGGLRTIQMWLDEMMTHKSLEEAVKQIVDFAFMGFGNIASTPIDFRRDQE